MLIIRVTQKLTYAITFQDKNLNFPPKISERAQRINLKQTVLISLEAVYAYS